MVFLGEGSNYYLDKFLAPKKLGLKVGCFTENIDFNHIALLPFTR
jgi:hypothetical protein